MWKSLIVMTVWKQNQKKKNKGASEVTIDAEIALIQMLV